MVRDVNVSERVSERWDLSSAFERELDRDGFREWEREDLSFEEEGDGEDDDEESSPREIFPRPGMVVELDRGVAPTNGLKTEGTFSGSMLVNGGMTVP